MRTPLRPGSRWSRLKLNSPARSRSVGSLSAFSAPSGARRSWIEASRSEAPVASISPRIQAASTSAAASRFARSTGTVLLSPPLSVLCHFPSAADRGRQQAGPPQGEGAEGGLLWRGGAREVGHGTPSTQYRERRRLPEGSVSPRTRHSVLGTGYLVLGAPRSPLTPPVGRAVSGRRTPPAPGAASASRA